eukprot:3526752-Amphidinium_carterae.1
MACRGWRMKFRCDVCVQTFAFGLYWTWHGAESQQEMMQRMKQLELLVRLALSRVHHAQSDELPTTLA